MKNDLLEKFCSLLTFSSISELSKKDLLENFYELKQNEEFIGLLGSKEEKKEDFALALNQNIQNLLQKEIIMDQRKEGDYIFIFHESKELKDVRKKLTHEERGLIFKLISSYVSLNTKKYEPKTFVYSKNS